MIIKPGEDKMEDRIEFPLLDGKLRTMITRLKDAGWGWRRIYREIDEFDSYAWWLMLYEAQLILEIDDDTQTLISACVALEKDQLKYFDYWKAEVEDGLWDQFEQYFELDREELYNIAFKE